MSQSVNLPALGESVTEGTVTRWLKAVGDHVDADEPLLEVSTDKVDTEIPSPASGTLEKILVGEDETVEVGAELAVIGDGSPAESSDGAGDAPAPAEAAAPAPAPEAPATQAPAEEPAPAPSEPSGSDDSDSGTAITLPALGESVTEGTVTRWLKAVGDHVDTDEPLLEVSTDKVDTEIPSPTSGTLSKIVVGEDETVEVGAVLAYVGGSPAPAGESGGTEPRPAPAGEDVPPAEQPEAPSTEAPAPAPAPVESEAPKPAPSAPAPAAPAAPATAPAAASNGSYVTPLVRKLAREQGIDLTSLTGTGVGGRIRKQDVLAAAEEKAAAEKRAAEEKAAAEKAAAAPAPAAPRASAEALARRGTTEKMTRLRKVIARRMVESLQTSAQLTTVVEVDVTRIAELRRRAKASFLEREGVKLSFLPFFALATVEALKVHPTVNASIDGEDIVYHASENLGIAVDTPRGLLVPVIKDAGDLNIAGFARRIADLAERTRTNKVTPDELSGGTFTLTNTGSRGALFDTPIINQPEVGILGTGTVVKRPVVVADADGHETIGIRSVVYLAISYDHRLVDGADAARFLGTVKSRLEEGAFESQLGL